MKNGVQDTEIPFKELTDESFLCKYDPKLVIFKHDKFYLTRNKDTGIIFANCTRCGAAYEIATEKPLGLETKHE